MRPTLNLWSSTCLKKQGWGLRHVHIMLLPEKNWCRLVSFRAEGAFSYWRVTHLDSSRHLTSIQTTNLSFTFKPPPALTMKFVFFRVKKKSTRVVFSLFSRVGASLRPLDHIIKEGILFCDHNNVITQKPKQMWWLWDRSHGGHLVPAGRSDHHINYVVLSCCQRWLKCLSHINYVTLMTHMMTHQVKYLHHTWPRWRWRLWKRWSSRWSILLEVKNLEPLK